MTTASILEKAHAEAVYTAMADLNQIGAKIKVMFGDVATEGINIFEESGGNVRVVRVNRYSVLEAEDYASQSDFAVAYGLRVVQQAGSQHQ